MRIRLIHRLARVNWLLVAIVALGLGLRLWGIGFGLPYLYHPDEGVPVTIALRMLHTGNLDPDFFDWPSLTFYLNALVYLAYFLFGKAMGRFAAPADLLLPDIETIAVGKALLPEEFLLARGLTAVFGALGIVAVYLICRDLSGSRTAGWLGALWFAVEPVGIRHSQYVRPDIFLVTFALFSLWFALRIVDDPRPRNYFLAGVCAGLATASKYNAAFIVLPMAVAHFARFRARGFARKEIYLAALASLLTFFATTPYALLDWNRFWRGGILGDAAHYASGHAGGEGDTLRWYVGFLWATGGWLLPLAWLESFWIVARREVKGIVLLTFPMVYFVFINLYTVRFETTILPVVAFVIILAARLVVRWIERVARWRNVALVAVALLFALPSLRAAAEYNAWILQPDTREEARAWLDAHLPLGARVVVEPYAPYVDPARFTVEGGGAIIGHAPEWYIENGFEYLVLSYGTYGRFFENPERYADSVRQYDDFFARFIELRRFAGSGPEIRVYQTGATGLPAQRVAARWGVYDGWLELVGYDPARAVLPGETLPVALYWRALKPRRELFRLTTRLLDRTDREIAQSSGELVTKVEAMVRVAWPIAVPKEAAPGVYRIELDVDAEDVGRVPVLDRQKQPIADKLFIGPFKIAPTPPTRAELDAARRVGARFGDAFALVGYTLANGAPRAGESLNVTVYWQSIAKSDKDYTVFVHLLDSEGKLRAQLDTQPRGGAYPTTIWDAGEIVRDDYALALPRDLAPGEYRIAIGLYAYPSLARLPVQDARGQSAGDHVVLDDQIELRVVE